MQRFACGDITATFPATTEVTQTADGGLIVHGAQEAVVIEHDATHAQIDRQGSDASDLPPATGKIELQPGQCAILQSRGIGRGGYWNVPGRSTNAHAMPIVSVPWPKTNYPVLRPPVLGSDPISRFLRSAPIPVDRIDVAGLPSPVQMPEDAPSSVYWAMLFDRYSGDHYSGWNTDTRTPDRQHPGYGSYLLGAVSEAATALCYDVEIDWKRTLARGLTQWGLDLAGAFASGRESWMTDGGHCQGRTALIAIAGKLLGVREMMRPMDLFGHNMVESRTYYEGEWWCGISTGWRKHWADAEYLSQPPSEWDAYQRWAFAGYYPHVVGGSVGTILAFEIMGLAYSLGLCNRAVADFMYGPGPDAIAELADAGIVIPWGESYAVGSGSPNLCGRAWRQVFG